MKILLCAVLLSFATLSTAKASEVSYTCEVTRTYNLENDGTLRTSNWDKQFAGSAFSVSRITGEIIGQLVPTLMATSVRVVNAGSAEYSFKAIADFEGPGVQLIEIQEFRDNDKKPFVAMSMGGAGIVTGICQ